MDPKVIELRCQLSQYDFLKTMLELKKKKSLPTLSSEYLYPSRQIELMTRLELHDIEVAILQQGVDYLEEIVKNIRTICGDQAADIMLRVYSHREGVENVAFEMGYSRRSLEMMLRFWNDHVVENRAIAPGESPWKYRSSYQKRMMLSQENITKV